MDLLASRSPGTHCGFLLGAISCLETRAVCLEVGWGLGFVLSSQHRRGLALAYLCDI